MSQSGPLVLFVDDDADTREMYQLALSMEGFAVVVAANVAGAMRCVIETPPAVIVTDLSMPGADGFELIQWLHAQATSGPPIVALTGWTDPDYEARAREAGCAVLCIKPYLPGTLAATIRTVLAAQHVHA